MNSEVKLYYLIMMFGKEYGIGIIRGTNHRIIHRYFGCFMMDMYYANNEVFDSIYRYKYGG